MVRTIKMLAAQALYQAAKRLEEKPQKKATMPPPRFVPDDEIDWDAVNIPPDPYERTATDYPYAG